METLSLSVSGQGKKESIGYLHKWAKMAPTVTKGEGRKPLGSEGSNELPGAPVHDVGYSDEEVEEGLTDGCGEADERESKV